MQSIDELKDELRHKTFDQGFHWRILFLGRSINGTTDIVSSMSRSLRNLGHHVLDLDTKYHRITENPERAAGGKGPIYVQASSIKPALDRFKPQMIVCCAGGLTFTDEDAAWLKAQGIVLVGITLSDPDVFPSVHGHAHVFDVHTTNAELSLQMYRQAGVENTVYFPFAIDRGFVTQHVDDDPAMAANVICLGHANDRPDRNHTMTALNRKFDVKTYGRGWEIPGSESVSGDKALQALKMGRIHINFPLTRAGYVNIKCGVFESMGAGGLVATGEFEEMSRFFEYGEEIIGYADEEDLSQKIQRLLDDPEEYERIRLNGFKRLINDHLYEHRWMQLFARLRNASVQTTSWLSEERRGEVVKALAPSLPRSRKVLLSGFYGAGNLGDELILRSISAALEKADPAINVVVAAENPYKVELDHGLQAFKRTDVFEGAHQLHTADAVVVGGGGLWHDLTFQRAGGLASLVTGSTMSIAGFGNLPLMGRVLGVPYHVIGLGAGPLEDEDAKAMVHFLASQTTSMLLRDEESRKVVEGTGVASECIETAPDVVYAVDLPDHPGRDEVPEVLLDLKRDSYQLIGINLRRWSHFDMTSVRATIEKTISTIAAGQKIAVVGIPMQAGASHDRQILAALGESLTPNVPFVILPDPPSFSLLDACLNILDVLVTMRLHAALVAHRRYIPTVGLAYDPKVQRHFEELGRSEQVVPLEVTWEELHDCVISALQENRISDPLFRERLSTLETRSLAALERAARRVSTAEVRAAVHTIPVERPLETQSPTKALTKQMAGFTKAEYWASGLELPGRQLNVLFDAPRALHVSLPVTAPKPGQEIHNTCTLRLKSTRPVEISLTLVSNYVRPQNEGKITIRLRAGNHIFTDDLARSKEPVMLRLRTSGSLEIPVDFGLTVNERCYPAQSWPRYSRVSLRVEEVHDIEDRGPVPALFASSGVVSVIPVEDQESRGASEDHNVAASLDS